MRWRFWRREPKPATWMDVAKAVVDAPLLSSYVDPNPERTRKVETFLTHTYEELEASMTPQGRIFKDAMLGPREEEQ